jgi:hypothetical protein
MAMSAVAIAGVIVKTGLNTTQEYADELITIK